MWLLLVTTAATYCFRIYWLQLCFLNVLTIYTKFFFSVLTMLVWQEELDWNEMLMKRYIGREEYALNSKQLNYALILLVMTLWNLLNCFFLFLISLIKPLQLIHLCHLYWFHPFYHIPNHFLIMSTYVIFGLSLPHFTLSTWIRSKHPWARYFFEFFIIINQQTFILENLDCSQSWNWWGKTW